MRNFFILALMSFLMVFQVQAQETMTISDDTRVFYEKQAVINWAVNRTKNKLSFSEAYDIVETVYKHATKAGVDPLMVIGMISKESMFRKKARSGYGAKGLMQVVPRWHGDKIKKRDIYNHDVNIEVGVKVLYDCLKRRSTVPGALKCYSGGARGYDRYVQARHKEIKDAIVLGLFQNEQNIDVNYKYAKPLQERPVIYASI